MGSNKESLEFLALGLPFLRGPIPKPCSGLESCHTLANNKQESMLRGKGDKDRVSVVIPRLPVCVPGLVKAKKYDWKDSNMVLVGSETDRKVKSKY